MTESKRKKVLERVAKLMAHAEGTQNEDERDAFIAKADALMLAYAIEEHELARTGKAQRAAPIHERLNGLIDGASPIREELTDLVMTVATHTRVKAVFHGLHAPKRNAVPIGVSFIGFEEDVEYCQMLFTTLHMELARQLYPRARAEESYEDNLVRLKEAGLKWEDVHTQLAKAGLEPFASEPHEYAHAVKMSKDYAKICAKTDRPQLKVNPVTYQRNFAAGFQSEVARRLRELRDRQRAAEKTDAPGTALVLADRKGLVEAKTREVFPKLSRMAQSRSSFHGGAQAAGRQAGARADLGQSRFGGGKRALGGGSNG